jgi:phosphate transport system protein
LDESSDYSSEELEAIRFGMVHTGRLVVENLRRAGQVMLDGHLALVPLTVDADQEINALCRLLEGRTYQALARRHLVDGALRFAVATTRVLYELERSGDLVVNCARIVARESGLPDSAGPMEMLRQVVDECSRLFSVGVDVLATMDSDAGSALDAEDDVLDDLVECFHLEVGNISEDIGLETAMAMAKIGRFLERIGDHAVNVGENVAYVVTGQFPGDTPTPH